MPYEKSDDLTRHTGLSRMKYYVAVNSNVQEHCYFFCDGERPRGQLVERG